MLRSRFSLFTKAQNAFKFSLRVLKLSCDHSFAEEGTRRYANCLPGNLSSTTSRTFLSTSCASVAFFAFYESSKRFQVLASSPKVEL
ncbi:hypothetical protein BV917_18115 [Leptospira santarosai serovar Guaricura]|nr:hypothetical protein BV917_18115 [Leptospira santarosai serovar Guaricura]